MYNKNGVFHVLNFIFYFLAIQFTQSVYIFGLLQKIAFMFKTGSTLKSFDFTLIYIFCRYRHVNLRILKLLFSSCSVSRGNLLEKVTIFESLCFDYCTLQTLSPLVYNIYISFLLCTLQTLPPWFIIFIIPTL